MRSTFSIIISILAGLLLAGCLPAPHPPETPVPSPSNNPSPVEPVSTSPVLVQSFSALPEDTAPLPEIAIRLAADYVAEPTTVTHAGDGSNRLFVLERPGKIRLIEAGLLRPEPFLDLEAMVESTGLEQGLLGLAFHPNFPTDPRFFIHYVDKAGDVVIASYQASPDLNGVDPATAQTLLVIEQFFMDHNGGQLAFGPDGYLYIAVGEGGLGADPAPDSLLGKILRIDVDSGHPYGIPPDNPFVDRAPYRPEIWAAGLRNPWRFSFDRLTGDLYIGDNGENLYEEINFEPAGSPGGLDYGWRTMEASHCFESQSCQTDGFTLPLVEYGHGEDCSVQGGYVYRGERYPSLEGVYLFGDYCSGKVWGLRPGQTPQLLLDSILNISSFGEDEAGELYITDLFQGGLYQIVVPADEPLTNWPGAWPLAAEPEVPLNVDFEGGVRLAGYSTNRPLASPGGIVRITLFWQGESVPEMPNVFVQLRDKENKTVAQADHPLFLSREHLTPDGAMLRDGATLALPPDLSPGDYRLLAGFYDPQTADRLGVIDDQTGENAAVLAEFTLMEED